MRTSPIVPCPAALVPEVLSSATGSLATRILPAALLLAALSASTLLASPSSVAAQEPGGGPGDDAATSALARFGERMVGTWEGDGSRHVFEWGVDRRAIRSRSYGPDGESLVSEGFWFWDPEDRVIRGRVVATGMGIDLFEYTTRVEDDRIVHDLTTHGAMAGEFVERWVFEDDGYRWSLEQDGEALMGGRYVRVTGPPGSR